MTEKLFTGTLNKNKKKKKKKTSSVLLITNCLPYFDYRNYFYQNWKNTFYIVLYLYLFSREAQLQAAAQAPLFTGKTSYTPRERYPNVFDKMEEARHASAFIGGVKVCTLIKLHKSVDV